MTRFASLVLVVGFLLAVGCNDRQQSTPAAADTNKIKSNLDQLTPEDRALADQQRVCPVSNGKLGEMGVPIKVMVKDKPVFICCKGCESTVKEKPDEMLQKVDELKSRNAQK